jgi:hypothetical protein
MRYDVLMAAKMTMFLWVVRPHRLVSGYQRFREMQCLRLQLTTLHGFTTHKKKYQTPDFDDLKLLRL